MIFDSVNTSYTGATLQIDGGAVFVAANDPAQPATPGALGEGAITMQVGSSAAVNPGGGTLIPTTAGANLGFMTYGPNHGIGSASPIVVTARNITVGGTGITYASAVLGGATDDYTAMNGNITLNGNLGSATQVPTTFFARNGGRVDFNGVISGAGSVVIGGNSVVVEGDANTPGISLSNNGTIVFYGSNAYTGATSVATGKLYINGGSGSLTTNSSPITVQSGATLGGQGTINAPVTVNAGGNLEAGQAGAGTLTLNGNLSFTGAANIDFTTVNSSLNGAGNPQLFVNGTFTTSNPVTINVIGSISPGDYALLDTSQAAIQTSNFTLATLPSRASGTLVVNSGNPDELDLDIAASGGSLLWTGAKSTAWDTSTTNWVLQGNTAATAYIDSPGDAVIFDDTADPKTTVTINGADVHPSSVTFNNTSSGSAYIISGTNAIAGSTGLTLNGGGTVDLLNTNTFTGPTTINNGTLQLGNGTTGHDGSISNSSSITDNGALVYDIVGPQTYGGMITGSGSLTVQGPLEDPGSLTLTNSGNSYTGATTIINATLQLGKGTVNNDGAVAGNVTDNGALVFNYYGNMTMSGSITGAGSVIKNGPGSLTLTSDGNSFSGPLTINQGQLIITGFANDPSGANIGGVGSGLITINTSGTLELNANNGGNVYNLANNLAMNGGVLYSPYGAVHVATGSGQTIAVGPNGGTIQTQNSGNDLYLDGQMTGSGSLALTNLGTNANGGSLSTVHVTNNTNTYSGTLTVNGASGKGVQLEVDANNALQYATVNVLGNTITGSTVQFGGSATSPVFGALSGTGNFGLTLPLTVGGNNSSTTYSGAMSGGGSLTRTGTGALTLAGANSYSGNTYITGGTLKLTGSAGLTEGLVSTTYTNTTGFSASTSVASWTQLSIQPTARWGASTNNGGANVYPSWGTDTIWGYAGYIDNTTSAPVTYTFGKNFDDGGYVQIDNTTVINDVTYTDLTTNSITLSPGLHTLEVLFAQGTGSVGPTGQNYGSFGIAYNTVGNTATTGTWLQIGPSSSNTLFLAANLGQVPSTTSVVMSSNTTFDASGTAGSTIAIGSLADAPGNPTGAQVLLGSSNLLTGNDNTNTQFSGSISGTGGSLTMTGSGTFTLAGPNTYTGGTTISSGTLDVEPVTGSPTISSLPANSAVTNNGTFIVDAANTTASGVSGTGALILGGGSGASPSLSTPNVNQNSITINAGAQLALHGPTQTASVTNNLSITGNGTLDLGGNGMIVNYTGTSPLSTIQAEIATGANGGSYSGPYTSAAITSSAAAANPTQLAIGYGEASVVLPSGGNFMGTIVPAGASAVLMRTTYAGDANLDGTVNFGDFEWLQQNYNKPGNWSQGDFNGDGIVNFSDFELLQQNYTKTYTASPSVQQAARTSAVVASSKTNSSIAAASKTAAASVGTATHSASPAASTPSVTFVLSINDNGSGTYAAGDYAIYAIDSTSDGNGGIVSFGVNYTGAKTVNNFNKIGAAYGNYDDGTGNGTDVEIGLNFLRSSTTTGGASPNLTASQDTIIGPAEYVYGFGQSSGNLATYQPQNSTGLDSGSLHTTLQTYGVNLSAAGLPGANSALLLESGTYSGSAPLFVLNGNGTPNGDTANVWTNNSSTDVEGATVSLDTITLSTPEPSSMLLLSVAAGGLLMRRRRRR